MAKGECRRCRMHREEQRERARGDFARFTLGNSSEGTFNINGAELLLRLVPREPARVSPHQLDAWHRGEAWRVVKRHLPHVDNSKPGILATLTHNGRKQRFLIEGFHRAENHRIARTEWTCYVLTPEETYAILTP